MKKLLFDVDGTILDSMQTWVNLQNEVLNKYNISMNSIPEEEKGKIEALPYKEMCKYLAENYVDMSYDEVVSYFENIIDDAYSNKLQAKEGAILILNELNKEGFSMAITSSTNYYLLESSLKRLGIFDLFDFIATPDTTCFKKSDSEYWHYVIDKFETEPKNCILFDDALYAIKSAKNIGISTVGIKDFPWNKKEWEHIEKESDFTLNLISEINIAKLK